MAASWSIVASTQRIKDHVHSVCIIIPLSTLLDYALLIQLEYGQVH